MGRPRKHLTGLPPYTRAKGRLIYLYRWDPRARRLKYVGPLCRRDLPLSEVHRIYEEHVGSRTLTVERIALQFEASPDFRALAPSTQRDYQLCRRTVCETRTTAGRAGETTADAWTRGTIIRYMDRRARDSSSRARHEGRWLKRLFFWAHDRELIPTNPAAGIKIGQEKRRTHYAAHEDLRDFIQAALSAGDQEIAFFSLVAYNCRLRANEILRLTDAQIVAIEGGEGLYCARGKGSNPNIHRLTGDLATAIRSLREIRAETYRRIKRPTPIEASVRPLFVSRTGDRWTYDAMKDRWDKVRDTLPEARRFNPHDMKRKGVSDTKGSEAERQRGSGHTTERMVRHYDVVVHVVDPPGGDSFL